MNIIERERLLQIRCRAKRGETLSQEEMGYCERMFREFPEEYAEMDEEVFDRTKPFGSV